MSKPSHGGSKVITTKAELIEWFKSGCTPHDDLLIGVEHEKPPFYLDTCEPVPYEGKDGRPGIKDFLCKMIEERGWRPVCERGRVIELQKNGVSWSLEPAGQMETGGAPMKSVHQNAQETDAVIGEAVEVAKSLGIGMVAIGYHPVHNAKELPTMPKSRYAALQAYIEKIHQQHGIDGLWCTSTTQVNLGYESEEDMVKKLRVALSLQPIVAALFANSPFAEGKPSGAQSYRSHIIHNYMGGRYGFMLPVAFSQDFGFEKFVDYAMKEVPLMGIYDGDIFMDARGGTFSDFMEGKLEVCPGRRATLADWENHLNTIWPEVRVRHFLEMRGADNGPAEMIKALPAFWVGILYDKQSLDAAYEMVCNWSDEDREYLRTQTPLSGLQTPFMSGATSVQELAKNCLALAEAGLKRRALKDEQGQDESIYLAPLHKIAESGKNWAQILLERYRGAWAGDISRLFEEQSYESAPSILKDEKKPEPIPAPHPAHPDPKL